MVKNIVEKRRYPRINIRSPLRYRILGCPGAHNTVADNLGVGGLSFVNSQFIKPATNLDLEINILSRVVNSTARVAWASQLPHSYRYKMGVEFLDLEIIKKRYIADYIDIERGTF